MKDLPVGIQDFKSIIEGNFVYVDKTEPIYEMVRPKKGVYFLSRPRRFGKSLTVSTFEYLFNGEKELFKGTYIYDKHDFKKHPVIKISMSSLETRNAEELRKTLLENLIDISKEYNLNTTSNSPKIMFTRIIRELSEIEKVVILIDEYDKPILDNIEKKELQNIREELRFFYSVIKDMDPYIRFVFITGISKFSKVSIFSDLNNLNDLTLNNNFSNILGYTKNDIAKFFPDRVIIAKKKMNLSDKEFWDKLKDWYNGYSWNGKNFIYNPFSILKLFFNNSFNNYWFESGSPSFLINYAKKHNLKESDYNNIKVDKSFHFKYDIENAPSYSFLWQAGYLTIKEITKTGYVLKYPNKEVEKSMKNLLLDFAYNIDDKIISHLKDDIWDSYQNNDINNIIEVLKRTYSAIPYQKHVKNEGFYDAVAYTLFIAIGINAKAEEATGMGNSDIILEKEDRIIVFEFKNAKPEVSIKLIKDKGYADKYNKKKFLVGIQIDYDKRNIIDYKIEEV